MNLRIKFKCDCDFRLEIIVRDVNGGVVVHCPTCKKPAERVSTVREKE